MSHSQVKMSEDKFGESFDGYGLTTEKDRHGDVFTIDNLKSIKKSFDEGNSENFNILNQHNPDDVLGKIISMEIEEREDGWAGLRVRGSIFKGKEKEFEKMKREGWGLSIGALYSNCNLTREEILDSEIKIEVSPYIHREIEGILNSQGLKYGVYLRKGLDFSTTISLVGLTLTNLYMLIDLLLRLKEQKESNEFKRYVIDAIEEVKREVRKKEV